MRKLSQNHPRFLQKQTRHRHECGSPHCAGSWFIRFFDRQDISKALPTKECKHHQPQVGLLGWHGLKPHVWEECPMFRVRWENQNPLACSTGQHDNQSEHGNKARPKSPVNTALNPANVGRFPWKLATESGAAHGLTNQNPVHKASQRIISPRSDGSGNECAANPRENSGHPPTASYKT